MRKPSRFVLASSLALVTVVLAHPATAASAASPAEELAGRAVGKTPLMSDLRELCDTIGGRVTGSPACERAIDWAQGKFRDAGLDKVWTEEFTLPTLWLPGGASVSCTAPTAFTLHAVAAPFSPASPEIRARLVVAGTGAPGDFEALGDAARGAIALVKSEPMLTFEDLFAEYLRNAPMVEAARKAGVKGLLLMSTRPRGLLYRHPIMLDGTLAPFPVAMVAREEASRLARLAETGEVRVAMSVNAKTGGPYTSRNVLAEIPGREKPSEIVLIGAHLDSWELGTGAEDNGVNAATVIDIARGMKELGLVPRRTVRFALFTGEEEGMLGSEGYVEKHASEMKDHVMAMVFDTGSGRTNGFYLGGREDLRPAVEKALEPVEAFGPFHNAAEAIDGTDNFDFILAGVPNLVADQDPAPYLPNYHASSDVYDAVDAREAHINAAIEAAVIWQIADAPDRPGPRQSRAEVQHLLEQTGLVDVMKAFGQWKDWDSGRRGANP